MGRLSLDWAADGPSWPHANLSHFVRSAPHHWHVQIAGHGPDLLLLHGAGGSLHSWRDLLLPLAARHRVIAIDLAGHGFTRLGTRWRSGLDPMSADIARLLAMLGASPVTIVGHSAGGAIALRLAQILDPAPERIVTINGALENFHGVAGFAFPLFAKALAYNPLTAPLVAATISRNATERLIEGTGSHIGPEGIALYHRLFSDRHHVAGTLAMMEQWSLDRLLADFGRIPQPVLCLAGEGDLAVAPATSRKAAARLSNGSYLAVPRAGHLLHEEFPERVTHEILGFI